MKTETNEKSFDVMKWLRETRARIYEETKDMTFEERRRMVGDEVMATALIDRLLHHYHIAHVCSGSHRMRQHAELFNALRTNPDATEAESSP